MYQYRDHNRRTTDGEIWSTGPDPHTLWVLGPAGPVVVDTNTHTQTGYTIPTYDPGAHQWTYRDDYSVRTKAPIDFRVRTGAVGVAKWKALVASQTAPIRRSVPDNWDLTLELDSVACRAIA